jgi:hypothetical protein
MEITEAVVEADHDAALAGRGRGQRLVEPQRSVTSDDLFELLIERRSVDLDLTGPGSHPVVQEDRQITTPATRGDADRQNGDLPDPADGAFDSAHETATTVGW